MYIIVITSGVTSCVQLSKSHCMHVCMYASVHITYAYTHTHTHKHTHTHVRAHTHARTHAGTHVHRLSMCGAKGSVLFHVKCGIVYAGSVLIKKTRIIVQASIFQNLPSNA
jgi:hypothetical protein